MKGMIRLSTLAAICCIVLFPLHAYGQSNPFRCCPAEEPCDPYDQYEGQWEPWPDKLALLSIQAHADDEMYGNEWPHTLLVRKLPAAHVLMNSGWVQAGQTRKGTNGCSIREEELLNASRYYGSPWKPAFARYNDWGCRPTTSLSAVQAIWVCLGYGSNATRDQTDTTKGFDLWVGYLTYIIRRYKPEVLTTHDWWGEYNSPGHMACAFGTYFAYFAAGDSTKYPGQLDSLDVWQPKKMYHHRGQTTWDAYKAGKNANNANYPAVPRQPLSKLEFDRKGIVEEHPFFPELSDREFRYSMEAGMRCHKSQGMSNWTMRSTPAEFGLTASTVGPDKNGNDLFENIDVSQFGNIYDPVENAHLIGSRKKSSFPFQIKSDATGTVSVRHFDSAPFSMQLFDCRGRETVLNAESDGGTMSISADALKRGVHVATISCRGKMHRAKLQRVK